MAVEIIGQDKGKMRKATCENCGAVLSFYPVDIQTKPSSTMPAKESYRYIECPQCPERVVVGT